MFIYANWKPIIRLIVLAILSVFMHVCVCLHGVWVGFPSWREAHSFTKINVQFSCEMYLEFYLHWLVVIICYFLNGFWEFSYLCSPREWPNNWKNKSGTKPRTLFWYCSPPITAVCENKPHHTLRLRGLGFILKTSLSLQLRKSRIPHHSPK